LVRKLATVAVIAGPTNSGALVASARDEHEHRLRPTADGASYKYDDFEL
jgi:hypothetical protein